ncbi:MAG: hypothetical protein ABIR56_16705 [Polaromonas sp.]
MKKFSSFFISLLLKKLASDRSMAAQVISTGAKQTTHWDGDPKHALAVA